MPVPTLDELLTADPDHFVASYTDIAAVNLACARGLPNCDEGEFPKYLALLDSMAEAVKRQTERHFRLFKLKPRQFNQSEAVFRLYTMEHVFRTQFGVRYDPKVHEIIESGTAWNTIDSSETFIHGILSAKRTGTCSSLPTFAIAVGRRLGYPLKLILVPHHTLYRWDDGREVFNIQHNDTGGEVRPDEYFHTWPHKWTPDHFAVNEETNVWLHSLTPRKEVSKFLCNRALMLRDAGRFDEALAAIRAAERFDPVNPACQSIQFDIEHRVFGLQTPAVSVDFGLVMMLGGSHGHSLFPLVEGGIEELRPLALSGDGTEVDDEYETADRRRRAEAAFAEEQYRLVNLINESNRNRLPQHPNGNPPTRPLLRPLTQLLQNRKGH